ETYTLPTKPLTALHYRGGSSDDSSRSSNSSPDQSPKARKEPHPKRSPTSRKTGFATIRTDSTDTQPAFESDAFAVLMPTTRLPILESRTSPSKNASPAARADALRTYQEKARQIRERNNSGCVQIPSRIISYDYAAHCLADTHTLNDMDSRIPTPAGSFPISPPLAQNTWTRHERAAVDKAEEARHMSEVSKISEPVATKTSTATSTSTTSSYRVYRPDSTAGASQSTSSSSPLSPSITVRIKSRVKQAQEAERLQTESTPHSYRRPNDAASVHISRTSSPIKSMPNFTRHNSVEGDSIFGYKRKDTSGAAAGASPTSSGSEKEPDKSKSKAKPEKKPPVKPTETTPKRPLTSRWPWLRPQGPRIAKPTTAPVTFTTPTAAKTEPRPTSQYIDPFERLATPQPNLPTSLRAPVSSSHSPKKVALGKLATNHSARPASSASPTTPKFDSGFAQIKTFGLVLVKFCFMLYAVIALWFVLDAVREAIHTIGVPFRVVKWVGGWVWF
ncbi:hypothetical protein BDU57DRAFT_408287, partial [Ampelomyces quisqualis]